MAKKGGSFWDNPFGGMFDFNHDGKEDWWEQSVAFKMFEECTKKDKPHTDYSDDNSYHPVADDDDDICSSRDSIDTSWRDFCEDGSKYDIDPEDYESEEEYEDALAEAKEKVAGRATCEDGFDVLINPGDYNTVAGERVHNATNIEELNCAFLDFLDAFETDLKDAFGVSADDDSKTKEEYYPNKRRYIAACTLANKTDTGQNLYWNIEEDERKDKERCRFILDNADSITAANYLISHGKFLYAQAVKENFELPVSLPDEDEYRISDFSDVIRRIAEHNIALSFEVWEWSLTTFLPYAQYAESSPSEMTSSALDDLFSFPDGYRTELVRYMEAHPGFLKKVMDESAEMANDLDVLISTALQVGLIDVARTLFQCGLVQAGDDWEKINGLTESTISWCENFEELETAEYFKLNLLSLVKAIDVGAVQNKIDEWEKRLDAYISQMEDDCEQYAYTRKNAWRASVPDGSQYGLDPRYFDSEQEYLEALNEEKCEWN